MPASTQSPTADRYQFIPRVLVFLTRGEEVLLIRRAADRPIFPNQHNGLGGHVERGESVLDAARREVLEESGLAVEDLWLCAIVTIDVEEGRGIAMFVFRGEAPEGEVKGSSEGEITWVRGDQIGGLEMVEDIPRLLPRVLAMRPGDGPLFGHYWYVDGTLKMAFEGE